GDVSRPGRRAGPLPQVVGWHGGGRRRPVARYPVRHSRSGNAGSIGEGKGMGKSDARNRGTVLVTGGAGYIGSHVVLQLVEAGERVLVLDDLSTGFREALGDVPLVVGNVGDRYLVGQLLREHGVDTVMHFAARTIVPESVAVPLRYYGNNTCATRNL